MLIHRSFALIIALSMLKINDTASIVVPLSVQQDSPSSVRSEDILTVLYRMKKSSLEEDNTNVATDISHYMCLFKLCPGVYE
uniref:Uncharacterized protein n=1 Tax=Romanomermis culicivorax TaxID=13658 RepID=A0A915KNZ1_ROMCU